MNPTETDPGRGHDLPNRAATNPGCRGLQRAHFFELFSTKTVSQNRPLETAASKPVESPKSVSGDWLPTCEIARNRANSRVSQESKFEPGLVGIVVTPFRYWLG